MREVVCPGRGDRNPHKSSLKKAIHCVEEGKKGSAFGIYFSKKDTFKRAWQGTKLLLSRDSKKHWRMLARHIY